MTAFWYLLVNSSYFIVTYSVCQWSDHSVLYLVWHYPIAAIWWIFFPVVTFFLIEIQTHISYNSVVFTAFTKLCHHHHYKIPECFHHSKKNPTSISSNLPFFPPPTASVDTNLAVDSGHFIQAESYNVWPFVIASCT